MDGLLTERVVLLQGAVYLPVGVDLEVVFGGAVELPAPRRSSEVLIHSSAAPGIPPLPGVAGLARGAARPGPDGVQQAHQHQQRNHQHCGMAGEFRLRGKNGELLPTPPSPIQSVNAGEPSSPARIRAPRGNTDSSAAEPPLELVEALLRS